MLAEKFLTSGRENFGGGRRSAEHFAEAIDGAAFEVYTGKEGSCYALLTLAQKGVSLEGVVDVASEEDHARGLNCCEQGSEARRHLGAGETDDQDLADV
jgi:hypothetical protein